MSNNRKQIDTIISEELAIQSQGLLYCGADEAGVGPLCGDVVAAAVILPIDDSLEGVTDSKKLNASQRERLFVEITRCALAFSVARATVKEIDRLNIYHARMLAMRRAVEQLSMKPEHAFIDGHRIPEGLPCEATAIVKGDAKVRAIAAASIIAKVTRDREMQLLDKRYPHYGWAQNKGYPTKAHLIALKIHGISPYHRKSYRPVRELLSSN